MIIRRLWSFNLYFIRSWSAVSVSRGLLWWGILLRQIVSRPVCIISIAKKILLTETVWFCYSPGVVSNITQVLLPLWRPKVSISPRVSFCSPFPLHVHLSLHSSAQSSGRSRRAALYLCSNWPGGKPEVRFLPPHHQYTHLPLHSQVRLRQAANWFSCKPELWCRITLNTLHLFDSVISHGLKCFTNFSTTWLITSKKDR